MGQRASSQARPERLPSPREDSDFAGITNQEDTCDTWYLKHLPKANSVEITNDPRIVQDSVINKRFQAFQAIAVGATLMASLSLTTAVGVESMDNEWSTDLALAIMLMVFVMNILAVLVITQQSYQIHRLETSMSHGFEIAKSYYLNDNITKLRHYATQSFFWALPLYVVAVALGGYANMKSSRPQMSVVVLVFFCACAVILFAMMLKQKTVFNELHSTSKNFAKPLLSHMKSVHQRHRDNDTLMA